jgi:hypothetical protein
MSGTTECSAGAVRPITIPVTAEEELEALRARLTATRWPDPELVTDFSQGVQQAVMTSQLPGPHPMPLVRLNQKGALRND